MATHTLINMMETVWNYLKLDNLDFSDAHAPDDW